MTVSEYTEYPIYPAEVVDSNGAGDVFHGAFASAVVRGYSPIKCCHFASCVSALKCTGVVRVKAFRILILL